MKQQVKSNPLVFSLLIALLCGFTLASVWADDARYVRLTAGDGTSAAPLLAGQMASRASGPGRLAGCRKASDLCRDIPLVLSPQPSRSGWSALSKLRAGAVDLALVPDLLAYTAFTGNNEHNLTGWTQLRTLALVASEPLLVFVRPDHGANTLASLAGLRVALGARQSDLAETSALILAAAGLGAGRYQPVFTATSENAAALIAQNQADAVLRRSAVLAAPEREALAEGRLRLLNFGKGELEQISLRLPFLSRQVIDLGLGPNYATLGGRLVLAVREDMPPSLALTLLTRLSEDTRPGPAPRLLALAANSASRLPLPLHKQAASFYQETSLPKESAPHEQENTR